MPRAKGQRDTVKRKRRPSACKIGVEYSPYADAKFAEEDMFEVRKLAMKFKTI